MAGIVTANVPGAVAVFALRSENVCYNEGSKKFVCVEP
jgi:hypothetical protein